MDTSLEALAARVGSPTIHGLHERGWGLVITCAECLNTRRYLPATLPAAFNGRMNLTLIELERRCRCVCGASNARAYPYEPGP